VCRTKESTLEVAQKHFNAPVDTLEGTVKRASSEGVELEEYPGRTFRFSTVGMKMADLVADDLGRRNSLSRAAAVEDAGRSARRRRIFRQDQVSPRPGTTFPRARGRDRPGPLPSPRRQEPGETGRESSPSPGWLAGICLRVAPESRLRRVRPDQPGAAAREYPDRSWQQPENDVIQPVNLAARAICTTSAALVHRERPESMVAR
jgi:hypothetical protein